MLTGEQAALIRRYGVATLHDHEIISAATGEPFIDDDVLVYYDGRALLVCAQPLRGHPAPTPVAVRQVVARWIEEHRVDFLIYVGPSPVTLSLLREHGFALQGIRRRVDRSAELFLAVDRGTPLRDHCRHVRRAKRRGFTAEHRPGGMVNANYLTLTEQFFGRLVLSEYLAELAISLPLMIMSPRMTIIEAWEGSAMRGFVLVHEPFDGVSVAVFIAHDGTAGICDFLYARLLEHGKTVGSEFVNVGPSPSKGHYDFKRKWRGIPLVQPYYAASWRRRGGAASRWLLRILGRN